jgi:hypothetical protein
VGGVRTSTASVGMSVRVGECKCKGMNSSEFMRMQVQVGLEGEVSVGQ